MKHLPQIPDFVAKKKKKNLQNINKNAVEESSPNPSTLQGAPEFFFFFCRNFFFLRPFSQDLLQRYDKEEKKQKSEFVLFLFD